MTAELVRLAAALQPGDPRDDGTTLTPMVDERQLQVVQEHVSAAVAAGAQCLTGGRRLALDGSWYPATVLTGCTPDMAVMTQETFGPVAPITVVRDFEEGLRLAAESEYGLAATVLTPDSVHALRAVEELDVGTVKVNAVFGGRTRRLGRPASRQRQRLRLRARPAARAGGAQGRAPRDGAAG